MKIDVEVKLPSIDVEQKIKNGMNSILRAAGTNLAKCIRRHMRHLNASRHSPLSGGKSSNHFSPDKVSEPRISNDAVTVAINIPGITRAYHDIDIYPVEANALAIPLHESAYGISPREANDRGTYRLFRIKKDGVPGNVLYRNDEDGSLIPMYALTQHVHQVRDPSLMPTNKQLTDEALDGAVAAVKAILGAK
jgi:hypothetical protein